MHAMKAVRRHARYSLEEYLHLEEYSNVKHEYVDGWIIAMAGGTPEHGAMAARIIAHLVVQLSGRPCNVYTSDVRVRVAATGLDTYPDVSIVCGEERRDLEDKNALTNPVALVEVLSESTKEYDRGEKLEHYKQIPSLRDVLLLSHREPLVERWQREASGSWGLEVAHRGDTLRLDSIGCTLVVDDIYRDPLEKH